jgi:hypothetical protein
MFRDGFLPKARMPWSISRHPPKRSHAAPQPPHRYRFLNPPSGRAATEVQKKRGGCMGPGRQLRQQLGMTLQQLRRKIDHELISRMADLNDRFPEFSVTKIQSL